MSAELNVNPFSMYFDLKNGISKDKESTKRYLSNMKGMFADDAALDELIKKDNSLIYEFYELKLPETPGNLLFGTSIVYPARSAVSIS